MKYYLILLALFFSFFGFAKNNAKHYYVIVKAFRNEVLAKQYKRDMKKNGYNANLYYNQDRGFYYIYFEEISSLKTAAKEKEILRSSGFENAWVFSK